VLHRLEELAEYLEEIALQLEHYPAGEDSQEQSAARIAGKGKGTALAAAVVAVQELARPSAVVVVAAVRSWLQQPGTTVPTLPSWPPGSAVGVAAPALALEPEAEACTMAGTMVDSCTLLVLVEELARQHMGPPAVMGPRKALANLHYCCLHMR
jgi:hypothetical protein